MENPLVSIIIPAYNEESYIGAAIESSRRQSYDKLERIVVANACSDATASVARSLGATVIETEKACGTNAKNLGAEDAHGDIYVFFDADSIMKVDLIQRVVARVQEGYKAGKAKIWPIETGFRAKLVCSYWNLTAHLLTPIPGLDSGSGGLMFSTRDLFDKLKSVYGYGWDPQKLSLGDVDYAIRAKKQGNFKYMTESGILTSMRRIEGRSLVSCFMEDAFALFTNPKNRCVRKWKR